MKIKTLFAAAALALSAVSSFAHGDAIEVENAWVRATVKGQMATGAFMTITAKDGHVTGRSEAAITVELTGVVAQLAKMSSDNRAMYGILSIVVAIAAGFGVGMIFKKGGGSH